MPQKNCGVSPATQEFSRCYLRDLEQVCTEAFLASGTRMWLSDRQTDRACQIFAASCGLLVMEVAVRHHSRLLLLANASTLTGPHRRSLQQIFAVCDHAGHGSSDALWTNIESHGFIASSPPHVVPVVWLTRVSEKTANHSQVTSSPQWSFFTSLFEHCYQFLLQGPVPKQHIHEHAVPGQMKISASSAHTVVKSSARSLRHG